MSSVCFTRSGFDTTEGILSLVSWMALFTGHRALCLHTGFRMSLVTCGHSVFTLVATVHMFYHKAYNRICFLVQLLVSQGTVSLGVVSSLATSS